MTENLCNFVGCNGACCKGMNLTQKIPLDADTWANLTRKNPRLLRVEDDRDFAGYTVMSSMFKGEYDIIYAEIINPEDGSTWYLVQLVESCPELIENGYFCGLVIDQITRPFACDISPVNGCLGGDWCNEIRVAHGDLPLTETIRIVDDFHR